MTLARVLWMSLITYTTVAYPDLQDNEEGGGGGRGHPDPEIRRAGAVSKIFFGPSGLSLA